MKILLHNSVPTTFYINNNKMHDHTVPRRTKSTTANRISIMRSCSIPIAVYTLQLQDIMTTEGQ